jgi:hypothetical protein
VIVVCHHAVHVSRRGDVEVLAEWFGLERSTEVRGDLLGVVARHESATHVTDGTGGTACAAVSDGLARAGASRTGDRPTDDDGYAADMSTPEPSEPSSSTPSAADDLLDDDQLDQIAGGIGNFGFPVDGKP